MTATDERPRITRPGSGVAIDPRRLMAMRHTRDLKRYQLSGRIRELDLRDDKDRPILIGVDHLGKLETGQRKPSQDAFRALCAALGCTPVELMPGGPALAMPKAARDRKARLDYNDELRQFAIPRGLRYKNPRTGRVYYGKRLREAYALLVALELTRETGTQAGIREAEAAFAEALTLVPRALGQDRDDGEDDGEDETDLLAS